MTDPGPLDRFAARLEIAIRLCGEGDLEALEWYGRFREHREIIRDAFDRQRRGENLMYLAVANRFPVGQVWADLERGGDGGALFWAFRVFPLMRGCGIGRRLLLAAERDLVRRGVRHVEIGAEKKNPRARRLYERLGYTVVRELNEAYEYTTPDGVRMRVPVDEWMLRKELSAAGERRSHWV